jgi:predicted PurR-regulated permease PerM
VPDAPPPDRRAAVARSRAAWADLRERLSTATPAAVGRAALGIVVLVTVAALIAGTWPVLLPFLIGGLLAYAVLPVVDALDRVMPRALAAAISMLGVIAAIVAVFVIVVPPLVAAVIDLTGQVPDAGEIEGILDDVLGSLPDSAREVIEPVLIALAAAIEDGLASASGGLTDAIPAALDAALRVAGAVFGLLVLPAWLLTVLSSNRRGRIELDRRVAGWLRPDFWALVRMFDRAAGTYLRGFVVVAIIVGAMTWVGLTAATQFGGPEYRGTLAIAVFAGAVQVVPELGLLLGFIPALLLAAYDPDRALVYIGVYLVARWVGSGLIGGRILEDRLRVPRGILIPGVVVLSQLGPVWLLLSAPILAFSSDLVRYLHGRLAEPPRPAGVLPGEPLPTEYVMRQAGISPRPAAAIHRRQPPSASRTRPAAPDATLATTTQPITR